MRRVSVARGLTDSVAVDVLHLDHVSLMAPSGALEQLGFRLTATTGTDDHSRVLLDRGYLEVMPLAGGETGIRGRGWFLRPADLVGSVTALRAHGIAANDPTVYQGRDGAWLDVELAASATAMLPVLTRRVDLPTWPPHLRAAHDNRAISLAGVHVRTSAAATLIGALQALGAVVDERGEFVLADAAAVRVEQAVSGEDALVALRLGRHDGSVLTISLAD